VSPDYIVVGAGSAGCVLAARLSADPAVRVLLVEAGGSDGRREVRIPAAFSKLFRGPQDWAYFTEPQHAMAARELYWPRGRMLGGTSSMNAMIYMRGQPADYDAWAAAGCAGWGWQDVLPVFKRSERHHRGASELHGGDGPLDVSAPRYVNPLTRAFLEAGTEVGLRRVDDFNVPGAEGIGLHDLTQRQGWRCSSADAFLRPALGRANLEVLTGAHVVRLIVDGARATGIEVLERGRRRRIDAGREIILAAGAVGSPQLLLLSGVGPAAELEANGVRCTHDLPGVGRNLQDHLVSGIAWSATRPVSMASAERPWHVLDFLVRQRGPLASNVGEGGGFVRTRPELDRADIQLIFVPTYFTNHGFTVPAGHGFTAGAILLRPRSRGRVTLRSADPLAPPCIDPCYLSDPADAAPIVAGLRVVREIVAARAFDRYRGAEVLPGARAASDEALLDHTRHEAQTLYHPVGTCRMGTDAEAVVDPSGRVHGIAGLRVADASIMPTIVGGNTNAPTIMIAEKIASLVGMY
jgi:choline dehydrogenase-like flavoprotein